MMLHSPSYLEWLLSARHGTTYQLWRAQLAMIDAEATSWLLKSPMHVVDYRSLFEAVPNARLIQIRRRATDVVRSFLNLCLEARRVFSRSSDGLAGGLGTFWLSAIGRILERAETDLDELHVEVICVDYDNLVDDPVTTTRDLLDRLGLEPATETPSVVTQPRTEQLPLEAFGLDATTVRRRLEPYIGGRFLRG
jgi:hypothetical protein